jgi:hypothetical protein
MNANKHNNKRTMKASLIKLLVENAKDEVG